MTQEEKIKKWCQKKSYTDENAFIKELRRNFRDEQIMLILDIIDDICVHCWDGSPGCYCCNDV